MLLALLACVTPLDDAKPAPGSGCEESTPWFFDSDGDGYGDFPAGLSCEPLEGAVAAAGDCDDTDPALHPGAPERCDGADQDCDGLVDEDLTTYEGWADADGDGFGDPAVYTSGCDASTVTDDDQDCDDADAADFPGAPEICDGEDDDCDGLVDAADPDAAVTTWYDDDDGDGYGDDSTAVASCSVLADHVSVAGDCQPMDPTIHPGAAEVCLDAIDQDCDGRSDDYTDVCWPEPDAELGADRCDAFAPVAVELCGAGIAAVLPGGAAHTTVQGALDAAAPGDTVTICPGTWSESLTAPTSPLAIVGFGPGVSVLRASGRVLDLGTGGAFTVSDLSIEDGNGTSYGGAIYGLETELCVARAGFAFNTAGDGGAIYLEGTGTLTIDESVFFANVAGQSGGALEVLGRSESIPFTIEDSVFVANSAGDSGGALRSYGPNTGTVTNVTFSGNDAVSGGGALDFGGAELDDPATTLTLDRVSMRDNISNYEGGGVALGSRDSFGAVIRESLFDGNSAVTGGGLVLVSYGDLRVSIVDSEFRHNLATHGGGIYVGNRGAHAVDIEGTSFVANVTTREGGAISMGASVPHTVTLTECSVLQNTSRTFGGVDITRGTLTSVGTDWGTGATDNVPDDVVGYTWSGTADFVCEDSVCN